jgi:hypothetical protein
MMLRLETLLLLADRFIVRSGAYPGGSA